MPGRPPALFSLALAASLCVAPIPSARAASGARGRAFFVEQTPVAVPLDLSIGSRRERMRLNLPSLAESIEVSEARRVHLGANVSLPATLDTKSGTRIVTVSFDEASGVATTSGRVDLRRKMHVHEGQVEVLELAVDAELDLFGLSAPEPHAVIREARVHLVRAQGDLAGAVLENEALLATHVFPLDLTESSNTASFVREDHRIVGSVTLAPRVVPASLRDGEKSRLAVHLYDAHGTQLAELVAPIDATATRSTERWASLDSDSTGAPRATIEWRATGARWTGTLSMSTDVPAAARRATVTFGDTESPLVVQAIGELSASPPSASLPTPF